MNSRLKKDIPEEIHNELSVWPDFLRRLLFYRNIKTAKEAEIFLNPEYKPHDPFLMKGMKEAVSRILSALQKGERITIFADYDADGIPGAVILNDFFKKIGYENFDVYIPDRHAEGFGLNDGAIREIAKRGSKLIITVDCGIADAREIELAKELGVETLVTDHHTPTNKIPLAIAVIDPKQDGCEYPFKELCGAGVAFKFVEAILKDSRLKEKGIFLGWEKWLLDMVGVATLSDMVPLVGENRIFAKYGLAVLRKTKRPGLNALFNALRIKKNVLNEDDIVFSISPRLNAASRMGNPMDAFKLLTTEDEGEAIRLAKMLDQLNNERKGVVAVITKEIKRIISERELDKKEVIVLGNPTWKPAILGLVAGTIAEEFNRPVFLWGRDTETTFKGSCRGGGGLNVLELMKKAEGVFIEYGGHSGAGGFSISFDKVHQFEEILLLAISDCKKNEEEKVLAEIIIKIEDINWNVFSHLERLSPFGEGNPKPIFLLDNTLISDVKSFGKENIHTRICFDDEKGNSIEAISFFNTPKSWGKPLEKGNRISLFTYIESSNFKGRPEIRLRIKDIL